MKKKLRFAVLPLLALVVLFSSCKKDEEPIDPKPTSQEQLSFAKVGHKWTYVVKFNGQVADTSFLEVISKNGDEYGLENKQLSDMTDVDTIYWEVSSKNLRFSNGGGADDFYTVLELPAKSGDKHITMINTDSITALTKNVNVSKTIPLGDFNCYEVEEYLDEDLETTYFIDKSKGIIVIEGTNGAFQLELFEKNF